MQRRLSLFWFVIIPSIVILASGNQLLYLLENSYPVADTVFAQKNNGSIVSSGPILDDSGLGIELVATGINFPASMSFLGDNDILVTEKNTGMVKRVLNGTVIPEPLLTLNVQSYREAGLLGIATDKPAVHGNPTHVYIYYSSPVREEIENGHEKNQITQSNLLYRYEYDDGKLVNPKLLLKIPYPQNFDFIHNGGIVLVGPDQNIYLAVGDLGHPVTKAQNAKTKVPINGTSAIYRITKDGLAAKDNPFADNMEKYYAYGLRNSFGMDFDPVTGKLWETENGPWYADEINIVEPGFNSGWKKVQGLSYLYGLYSKTQFEPDSLVNFDGRGKYSEPEFVSNETLAITAIKFLDSNKLGEKYENDVFVGAFNNGNIYHFDLNSNRTGLLLDGRLEDKIANTRDELDDVIFGHGFGAITDIEVGPDGYLYTLSLYDARDKCDSKIVLTICYDFNATDVFGSIFRIVPINE